MIFTDSAFQALEALLDKENCERVANQVFYINDDRPVNINSFLDRFNSAINGEKELVPVFNLSPGAIFVIGCIFYYISLLVGKSFKLPFWGLTPMEAKKVGPLSRFSKFKW